MRDRGDGDELMGGGDGKGVEGKRVKGNWQAHGPRLIVLVS